jgi:hypothetical protein
MKDGTGEVGRKGAESKQINTRDTADKLKKGAAL